MLTGTLPVRTGTTMVVEDEDGDKDDKDGGDKEKVVVVEEGE